MREILTINCFIYINGYLFELSLSKVTSLLVMPHSSWSMIPVNGDEFLLVRKIFLELWFPGTYTICMYVVYIYLSIYYVCVYIYIYIYSHTPHIHIYKNKCRSVLSSIDCKPLHNTNKTDTMARDSTLFSYQESHSPVFPHTSKTFKLNRCSFFFTSVLCGVTRNSRSHISQ